MEKPSPMYWNQDLVLTIPSRKGFRVEALAFSGGGARAMAGRTMEESIIASRLEQERGGHLWLGLGFWWERGGGGERRGRRRGRVRAMERAEGS